MVSLRDQKRERERDRKKRGEKTEKKKRGIFATQEFRKSGERGGVLKGREKGKVTWKT